MSIKARGFIWQESADSRDYVCNFGWLTLEVTTNGTSWFADRIGGELTLQPQRFNNKQEAFEDAVRLAIEKLETTLTTLKELRG